MADTQKQIVSVAVTGASGAILAQKTLALLEEDTRVGRAGGGRDAEGRAQADSLRARYAVQPRSSGEHAAGAAGGSGDHAGGAGVLSPAENGRRPCYAIRLPSSCADWAIAGQDVSV